MKYEYWKEGEDKPAHRPRGCQYQSRGGTWHAEADPPKAWLWLKRRWPVKTAAEANPVKAKPVKANKKAGPGSIAAALSLLRAYVDQTAIADSGNPVIGPKRVKFTPAQIATIIRMKG